MSHSNIFFYGRAAWYAGLLTLLLTGSTCWNANAQNTDIRQISVSYVKAPLFKGLPKNPAIRIRIYVPAEKDLTYKNIEIRLDKEAVTAIERFEVLTTADREEELNTSQAILASAKPSAELLNIPVNVKCLPGLNYLWISAVLKPNADIDKKIALKVTALVDENGKRHEVPNDDNTGHVYRLGVVVRKAMDDSVHTYRIPGVITTNRGTLIAVYDVRYKSSRDLPGHVDVGMSRSTDGGKTWNLMKIILDMGPPHENNGVGDPAILFDPVAKKIWVAALWSKGNRSIAGSEPGLSPDSTGQFVLASSNDDGMIWSEPYNITSQVKNPRWHLYFQGPGTGIAMNDGTLVFASQYWDESRKPGRPHSSIIYSTDRGKTWKSGIGAKSNTTESQVVETLPGTLMLNMRDNRGGFRSVAISKDMGSSWIEHPSSRAALPDPVCMASVIKANVRVNKGINDVLFFSNVATSHTRKNLTIKASVDLGESWPANYQFLIDERSTFGYSSLTRIDENTIAILYEGERDLYFVRIPVNDILK